LLQIGVSYPPIFLISFLVNANPPADTTSIVTGRTETRELVQVLREQGWVLFFLHVKVKLLSSKKPIIVNKLERYFWELRIFTIQVIQNRQYQLWERLIVLGLFYQKLQAYLNQDRLKEIPGLVASYTNMLEKEIIRESLADIPEQSTVQMKLLKELADERFFRGINSPRYLQCFSGFLRGIEYKKGSTEEEIGGRYHQAYQEYYQPYMNEKEYVLENYLVNYVFKNLFPLGKKRETVFAEYLMLIIHYSLIKMHLIGMAAFHQGLQDELVLKLIQSFAKTVEHNPIYLLKVRELLKANNLATMAYAAIMIKN
jgi:lysine-N-methylase